jgi:hypothetical protein
MNGAQNNNPDDTNSPELSDADNSGLFYIKNWRVSAYHLYRKLYGTRKPTKPLDRFYYGGIKS